MSVIGLDLSLRRTGYAVLEGPDSKDEPVIGVIEHAKGVAGMSRLDAIRNEIMRICFQEKVEFAVVEGYSRNSPFGREECGELGGLIRWSLYRHGIDYANVAPARLKKFATGDGKCEKDKILLAVYKKWGKEFETNDEADAYVMAKMAQFVKFGSPATANKYELEVVGELKDYAIKGQAAGKGRCED